MLGLIGFPLLMAGLLAFAISSDDDSSEVEEDVIPEDPEDTVIPDPVDVPDVPEDPEEPVVPDEPEVAPSPESLITVTDENGIIVPDASVLSPPPETGSNAQYDHIVSFPELVHDIDVAYDPETSFLVETNNNTESVDVHLNSSVAGPPGVRVTTTTESDNLVENEDGVLVPEYIDTLNVTEYDSSVDVTVHVDQEAIGVHVFEMLLTNPDNTVHFEVPDDFVGNLHVYDFYEASISSDSTYAVAEINIIWTPPGVDELSEADIEAIRQGDPDAVGVLIADIDLGRYSSRDVDIGMILPAQNITFDSLNDSPVITSNIEWSSYTTFYNG